jgi:hypothetical protein
MDLYIRQILKETKKEVNYFLNGGCYIFAKKLKGIFTNGNILYLLKEYHFVFEYEHKFYDASGNVSQKYANSKYIYEEDFLQRKKLVREFFCG